jgi:hypothetical protein
MRQPIDLHGTESSVRYPSSIFSLERHENMPHERLAYNVLRLGIEALHSKQLPEQINVEFPSSSDRMPAWVINASIRAQRGADGTLLGFNIAFPELLPSIILLFVHVVTKPLSVSAETISMDQRVEFTRKQIQHFVDIGGAAVRAYRSSGLATAIRSIYATAQISFAEFQDDMDYFDSIAQFIANHELAHAYIGQVHGVAPNSPDEFKAFELIADLLGVTWMFNIFVLNTPNTEEYRKNKRTRCLC